VPVFDPAAFDEVAILPPGRVRHLLLRFDRGLSEILEEGFRCDALEADKLVTQTQLLGFPALAEALSEALCNGSRSTAAELQRGELAIAAVRPKIAKLLTDLGARGASSSRPRS
jgi:hypothetical protein